VDRFCEDAARAVMEADVFLLATGAGWSADSGLAVYSDVAKIEAYARRGLEYHDLCRPAWLDLDPALFWGFWGQCFQDYRKTKPHRGYATVARWRDRFFRDTRVASEIRHLARQLQTRPGDPGDPIGGDGDPTDDDDSRFEAYDVDDDSPGVSPGVGAFFCFTSNVDAHSFDHFRAAEVRECHGNVEVYQCAKPCSRRLWRAPLDLSFDVDHENARCLGVQRGEKIVADGPPPKKRRSESQLSSFGGGEKSDEPTRTTTTHEEEAEAKAALSEAKAASEAQTPPRVGRVRGETREPEDLLRHLPRPRPRPRSDDDDDDDVAFAPGFYPRCPNCGGPARPAILMFFDEEWLDSAAQSRRYDAWQRAVKRVARETPLKVVILEVGAGDNVPTVRQETEHAFDDAKGVETTLIRVNPEFPLADSDHFEDFTFIPVMTTGLDAIDKIDDAIQRTLLSREEEKKRDEADLKDKHPPPATDDTKAAATAERTTHRSDETSRLEKEARPGRSPPAT